MFHIKTKSSECVKIRIGMDFRLYKKSKNIKTNLNQLLWCRYSLRVLRIYLSTKVFRMSCSILA